MVATAWMAWWRPSPFWRQSRRIFQFFIRDNRLLGCLHHCLATGTLYSENIAFPAPRKLELAIAA